MSRPLSSVAGARLIGMLMGPMHMDAWDYLSLSNPTLPIPEFRVQEVSDAFRNLHDRSAGVTLHGGAAAASVHASRKLVTE